MYEDNDPWPLKCPECGEEFTKKIGWLKTHFAVKCPGVLNPTGPILCPVTVTYRTEQFCLDVAEAKTRGIDPFRHIWIRKERP
jgi:hypothetical protein